MQFMYIYVCFSPRWPCNWLRLGEICLDKISKHKFPVVLEARDVRNTHTRHTGSLIQLRCDPGSHVSAPGLMFLVCELQCREGYRLTGFPGSLNDHVMALLRCPLLTLRDGSGPLEYPWPLLERSHPLRECAKVNGSIRTLAYSRALRSTPERVVQGRPREPMSRVTTRRTSLSG